MLMESTVQILRGWPQDGALDRLETVKAASTLVQGDVVVKQTDGSVDKVGSGATSGAVGLVIKGNGDSPSVVASGNKAVVLWSNYIVQTSNYDTSPGTAWAPGVLVTAGGSATAAGKFTTSTATTNVTIGMCLAVVAASSGINGTTASVIIAVK